VDADAARVRPMNRANRPLRGMLPIPTSQSPKPVLLPKGRPSFLNRPKCLRPLRLLKAFHRRRPPKRLCLPPALNQFNHIGMSVGKIPRRSNPGSNPLIFARPIPPRFTKRWRMPPKLPKACASWLTGLTKFWNWSRLPNARNWPMNGNSIICAGRSGASNLRGSRIHRNRTGDIPAAIRALARIFPGPVPNQDRLTSRPMISRSMRRKRTTPKPVNMMTRLKSTMKDGLRNTLTSTATVNPESPTRNLESVSAP